MNASDGCWEQLEEKKGLASDINLVSGFWITNHLGI